MKQEEYLAYVKSRSAKSPIFKDCLFAFLFGGAVCLLGEGLFDLYSYLFVSDRKIVSTLVSITLIFCSALLTGLGIFDKIGKIAGAGTLVPITGFANAVVSPAMDNKSEGLIFGVGAKLFTIAGPVILYGTLCGAVYGVVYYLVSLF